MKIERAPQIYDVIDFIAVPVSLGDNAANALLYAELFSAAKVTRQVKWMTFDIYISVTVVSQGVEIAIGGAGAEVAEVIFFISDAGGGGTTVAHHYSFPIDIAANTRISARARLSDLDGIADATLLKIGAAIFG